MKYVKNTQPQIKCRVTMKADISTAAGHEVLFANMHGECMLGL